MTEITRRTVTRGAAWAAPVVAVAGAASAFAVTPPPGPSPKTTAFSPHVSGPGKVGTYTIHIPFDKNYPGCTVYVTSVVQGGVPYGLTPKSSPITRNWAGNVEVGTFTRTSGRGKSGTVTGYTTCGGTQTPFSLPLVGDYTTS